MTINEKSYKLKNGEKAYRGGFEGRDGKQDT